jgi:hypothetical protein
MSSGRRESFVPLSKELQTSLREAKMADNKYYVNSQTERTTGLPTMT